MPPAPPTGRTPPRPAPPLASDAFDPALPTEEVPEPPNTELPADPVGFGVPFVPLLAAQPKAATIGSIQSAAREAMKP